MNRNATGMRTLPTILAAIGILLLAFGFWGTSTQMGAARFSDGFIPIAASSAGGLVLIAGVLVDIMAERRHKKKAK